MAAVASTTAAGHGAGGAAATLPADFYWGGSTSAFQFEGGASEGGKGKSVYDVPLRSGAKFDTASDFYHHWREDIDLMAQMGFSAFRMSISWTRICPNGDSTVNEEGIAFYRQVFQYLRQRGIAPVVTLYHWDLPLALAGKEAGWLSDRTVDAFLAYSRVCFERFGDLVCDWLTLNEDNLCTMLPAFQLLGPSAFGPNAPQVSEADTYRILHNTLRAHFGAVRLCHELCPGARIGCMLASSLAYPLTPDPVDVIAAQRHNRKTMWDFLDVCTHGTYNPRQAAAMLASGFKPNMRGADGTPFSADVYHMDFISFSYYFSICQADQESAAAEGATTVQTMYASFENPKLAKSSFGWTIDPTGLRILMNALYDRYGLPVMVVENGLGVKDDVLTEDGHVHDDYRIEYLRQHIAAVRATVLEDHVPVLGYLPWGCIDLLSASGDPAKRYGFVYVDFGAKGMPRYRKDSFAWYQHVIATRGAEL